MKKPKVLVIGGYGINCEEETKYAFDWAGGKAEIVHINDLIDGLYKLSNYQIVAFPGGFAFGDDTGSGVAFANKIRSNIWEEFSKFFKGDHLVIGICNGFQMLVNLGLLPALSGKFGKREAALVHNETARYVCRWLDVKVENNSPWLKGIKDFPVPIAHGEGRLILPKNVLRDLKAKNLVALRYFKGEMYKFHDSDVNPTGTIDDIAGITDESGKILGLMPHPERGMFFSQRPDWPLIKEKLKREGKPLPKMGPGLQIFKNAINYFQKK